MNPADEQRDGAKDARVGDVIDGRYRITGVLGQGGVGTVYRAEHLGMRKPVALKLLHPDVASLPEVVDRFEREAFATGRVDHPNCVTGSDFGKLEDGTLYFVMELLQGKQLSDVLEAEHRVGVERAVHIVRHVLRGLAHAHRAGIVHRDIKPENVFLVEHQGDPEFAKILDFGLAKLVGAAADEEGKRLTRVGLTFGTPIYMSPEQASGQEVDERTDLYALSIMLYEMLAGRAPFEGDDPVTVLPMHMSCEVPPLAEVAPDVEVPKRLEALIRRGLAKRPGDRIASAKEYLQALNEIDLDDADEAAPVRTASRRGRPGAVATVPTIYAVSQTGLPAQPVPVEVVEVQRPGNARRLMLLGAALAAVGFSILYVLLGGSKSVDIAAEARSMIEQGHPEGAIAYLEAKQEAVDADADALLVLGHAYAEVVRFTDALDTYRRALELDPSAAAPDGLIGDLERMLGSSKDSVRAKVVALLELLVAEREHPEASVMLVAAASAHERADTRRQAAAAAEKLGLGAQIDRVRAYSLDLAQGRTCERRKAAAEKLRALGDPRAIEALRAARDRPGRRGKNANACLVEVVDAALLDLGVAPPSGD